LVDATLFTGQKLILVKRNKEVRHSLISQIYFGKSLNILANPAEATAKSS
jgi:hypothetical protein